jgi:hypothetical protein
MTCRMPKGNTVPCGGGLTEKPDNNFQRAGTDIRPGRKFALSR